MNNSKNENGYVLVVIIGILTILSLMTITFATLSRIETRATRNYTDSVKCEMVAKAGLEHAIYELRLDKFGTDTLAYNDNNYDENYDYYNPIGDSSWPGDGVFDGNDYDNDGDTTNDSQWIYFPAAASTADIRLPGKLRARYAILITDDREARVNVNVTGNETNGGSHTSNEGWSTFEIDLSNIIELASTGNGAATASDIIDERLGSDDAPGTSTVNDNSGKIPDPISDGIDNDGDLFVDEVLEDTDEPEEFNSVFPLGDDVPFGLLSEAEIMDTSSYTSRLETIFKDVSQADQASLNNWLTTYSADTILCPPYQLDGGTSTTMLNINALVNNEGAYTGGYYDSDKKAQMLVEAFTAGGVPDVERQQMAVNIIDFIDSNDTVTQYIDISGDTYYGVERTPYINEVEAQVSGGRDKYIELYNPYDSPVGAGWKIKLDGNVTEIVLDGSVPAGGYYVIDETGAEGGDQSHPNVGNLDTGGEELILEDNKDNVMQRTDYGSAGDDDSRQLNEPRPIPLTASAADPWEWTSASRTSGAENNNFDPTEGDDGWTAVTYADSFFVANRRFSNKGYLGYIHRGKEWSSVRVGDTVANPIAYPDLLQYITITDPSMDNIDNDGDGDIDTYDTDGDGDIDINDTGDTSFQSGDFDGRELRIPGLINVNTASTEVLASLPDGSEGTLGSTIAAEISSGSKPYESIGDLIDKVDGTDGITDTSATNKWDEEKKLRAISNLITTRSNVFTVYVTAQITDEAISNVYAEKRIQAIVDRSVDPIKIRYFRWLTE